MEMYWIDTKVSRPGLDSEWSGTYCFRRSVPVLLSVKEASGFRHICIGFWQQYEAEDPIQWKESGRDSYTIKGEVTHWMPLPELPYV